MMLVEQFKLSNPARISDRVLERAAGTPEYAWLSQIFKSRVLLTKVMYFQAS